jgi:hypothetical protein
LGECSGRSVFPEDREGREKAVLFTVLGLVSATLFGVFFGSEGDLPPDLQDFIFFSLIIAGVFLHALGLLYRHWCKHHDGRLCRHA